MENQPQLRVYNSDTIAFVQTFGDSPNPDKGLVEEAARMEVWKLRAAAKKHK